MTATPAKPDPWKDFKNEVDEIEKRFRNIFALISSQLRTLKKARTKNQGMINQMQDFANVETPGLKTAIGGFVDCLKNLDTQQQRLHDRVDIKVFDKLGSYASVCKKSKELINKRELSAVNREKKKAEFEKVNKNTKASERDKTTARVSFVEADKDLRKADSVLLEHVQEFERDRIRDMKAMFMEYAHAELTYHGKCLEMMTKVYNMFDSVNEEKELATVLDKFRPKQLDQSMSAREAAAEGGLAYSTDSGLEGDLEGLSSGGKLGLDSADSRDKDSVPGPKRQQSSTSLASSQGSVSSGLGGSKRTMSSAALRKESIPREEDEDEEDAEPEARTPYKSPAKQRQPADTGRTSKPSGRDVSSGRQAQRLREEEDEDEYKVSSLDEGSDADTHHNAKRRPASTQPAKSQAKSGAREGSSAVKKPAAKSREPEEDEQLSEEDEEVTPPVKRNAGSNRSKASEPEVWNYSD